MSAHALHHVHRPARPVPAAAVARPGSRTAAALRAELPGLVLAVGVAAAASAGTAAWLVQNLHVL